jgi:hypothetical protein
MIFGVPMKNKTYHVTGTKRDGHRIAVPECVGSKAGDRYDFTFQEEIGWVCVPKGALIFTRVKS